MRSGVAVSALAHSALLALGVVSFANVEPHEPQEVASIDIELIPIEEFSNVRLGATDSDVIETDAPSPVESAQEKVPEVEAGNAPEPQPKADVAVKETPAPTVETAPEPIKRPPTEITPEPEPEPEPEPVKEPVPEPEPEPVEVAKIDQQIVAPAVSEEPVAVAPKMRLSNAAISAKRKAYAEQKKEGEASQAKKVDISKIINEEESRGATQGSGGKKSAGSTSGTASRLTRSERDALAAQMRKCWNPPIAALARDDLFARVVVDLNKDGTVARAVSVVDGSVSQLEATMGMAAQRAVRRCAPYKLSAAKYEDWKRVDVTFDPKDLR